MMMALLHRPSNRNMLRGIGLILLYIALLITAAFVLTLIQNGGSF